MNCVRLDSEGKVSAVFQCDDEPNTMRASRTFMSDDPERINRIQKMYKPSKMPALTEQAKKVMLKLQAEQQWGELREMIKKYFGVEACCTSKMHEILAGL